MSQSRHKHRLVRFIKSKLLLWRFFLVSTSFLFLLFPLLLLLLVDSFQRRNARYYIIDETKLVVSRAYAFMWGLRYGIFFVFHRLSLNSLTHTIITQSPLPLHTTDRPSPRKLRIECVCVCVRRKNRPYKYDYNIHHTPKRIGWRQRQMKFKTEKDVDDDEEETTCSVFTSCTSDQVSC